MSDENKPQNLSNDQLVIGNLHMRLKESQDEKIALQLELQKLKRKLSIAQHAVEAANKSIFLVVADQGNDLTFYTAADKAIAAVKEEEGSPEGDVAAYEVCVTQCCCQHWFGATRILASCVDGEFKLHTDEFTPKK